MSSRCSHPDNLNLPDHPHHWKQIARISYTRPMEGQSAGVNSDVPPDHRYTSVQWKSCERNAMFRGSSRNRRPTTFITAPSRSNLPSTTRNCENFTVSRFSS